MTARRAKGEGGLRKRSDGRWEATSHRPRGPRKYHYGATQAEALRKKKRWEATNRPAGEHTLLRDWIPRWLDTHPRASTQTLAGYASAARLYLLDDLGGVPLSEITAGAAEGVYRDILGRGLSPRTANKAHEVLRAAMNAAVRAGLIPHNPVSHARTPTTRQTDRTALEREEVNRLFDVLLGHYTYGPPIVLTGSTAMRMSEVRGLRWEHVDLADRRLYVRETLGRHQGKHIWKDVKSGRSRRTIPLIDSAVKALQAAGPPGPRDLVFTNDAGDAPLTYEVMLRQLKDACREAQVTEVTLHELRHTAGSLLLVAGVPMFVVSRLLGHADVATTDRVYAHLTDKPARAAMDALELYMKDEP